MKKYTNKLSELLDGGLLDYKEVLQELLCYIGEDEVKDFIFNGFGGELKTWCEFQQLEDEE